MTDVHVVQLPGQAQAPAVVVAGDSNPASGARVVSVSGSGPTSPSEPDEEAFTWTQSTPASVFDVVHNLGFRPAGVALFSLDYGTTYYGFGVEHHDVNALRISMDVPTACVVVLS